MHRALFVTLCVGGFEEERGGADESNLEIYGLFFIVLFVALIPIDLRTSFRRQRRAPRIKFLQTAVARA